MKKTKNIICFACDKGTLLSKRGDYPSRSSSGEEILVPDIEYNICDCCGETFISLNETKKVDAYIAENDEAPTQEALRHVRDGFGVDQTEMSEILGLGSKTFHRWEKGLQVPSRSMGYYIRVLERFPDAFNWLRARGWRKPGNIIDFSYSFPALKTEVKKFAVPPVRNPARALFRQAA